MNTSTKRSHILLSLGEAIVGILLLVNPVGFTAGIIAVFGVVLLILGLCCLIQYFRTEPTIAALRQGLSRGCLLVLAGLFCVCKQDWFIHAFPILTALYGIGILVTGVTKIQWTVDRIRLHMQHWGWTALGAALTVICAIIILCNPFRTTTVLWRFTGIILLTEAAVDIVAALITREPEA